MIVNQLTLKEGVTPEDYEAWALQAADVPRSQPSVTDLRLVRAEALLGSASKPPFDLCEIVEVSDLEWFAKDARSKPMLELLAGLALRVESVPVVAERVG